MQWLNDHLKDDIALQVITVDFVETAIAEKEGKPSEPPLKKKKTFQEEEVPEPHEDDTAPGFTIEPTVELPRQAAKYSGWKKNLITELFAFCEPKVWSRAKKLVDSLLLLKQLMCFAFNLKCFDDKTSDKVGHKLKATVFASLHVVYLANGRRLRSVFLIDQFVDWGVEGFFSIEVVVTDTKKQDKREIRVYDKIHQSKMRVVPDDMMPRLGVTVSNRVIECNFCWEDAFIFIDEAKASKLVFSTLFPQLKRSLARKISDELGATEALSSQGCEKRAPAGSSPPSIATGKQNPPMQRPAPPHRPRRSRGPSLRRQTP